MPPVYSHLVTPDEDAAEAEEAEEAAVPDPPAEACPTSAPLLSKV